MKYFDSHSHYYDERFIEEREGGADPLISALLSGEVSGIINVGTSPDTCRAAIEQAEKYNHPVKREFAFLIAHSMLHLFGYDHMEELERETMELKQEEILTRLNITR